MKKWLIPVAIIAVLAIMMMSGYNNLVTLNENVDNQWSQVENQLQRRADLIPNLVNTVKGYAAQEKTIFTEIADARSRLLGAKGDPTAAADASQAFNTTLGRLLAISEAYPQLKSDANFRALQDELAGTENRLTVARKDYNDSVRTYNTTIKRFPTVIYARMMGFDARKYFQTTEEAKKAPEVSF